MKGICGQSPLSKGWQGQTATSVTPSRTTLSAKSGFNDSQAANDPEFEHATVKRTREDK